MGRVPFTGSAKIFFGDPTSIPDQRSIFNAVGGAIAPQPLYRDFRFLTYRSNLDMFVPKRTDFPIAASIVTGKQIGRAHV